MAGDRGPVSVAVLLAYNDETFTKTISSMEPKALMDTISSLQQEMKTEQESFNSLSQQLEGLRDKRTQQYRQISKDLMASQSRLTLLMNRSMQCFSQQPSRTQTVDRKVAANQKNTVVREDHSEPSVKTQAPGKQTNVSYLPNSVMSGSAQTGNQNADSIRSKTATQNNETTRVKLSLTEKKPSNHIPQSNSNSDGAKSSQVKNHVHVQSNNRDLQTVKMNRLSSTNSSESSLPTDRGQKDIAHESVKSKQVFNQPGRIQENGDETVKEPPKKIVYKIPQVSALRQTFEQKKPEDIPGKGKQAGKVSLNVSRISSVGKADNVSAREVPNSQSKQTYRSSVQMGSNSDATTSKGVKVNGDTKQTSSNGRIEISNFEHPRFKTSSQMDSVDHQASVSDNCGVQAGQHKTGTASNQKDASAPSSGKGSVGVFQNQADAVPVTSIDDIINERPESSQNSRQRSDSQKLNITSVVSKSHSQASKENSSLGMKDSGGTGSSLLEARLQRMRQGSLVARSRPQQQGAPSIPVGGIGPGLSSILERSKERASMGPWNPFAETKPAGYGSSSSIFRNTDPSPVSSTSTLGKKYTPMAPQFESRQASSDLLRVREMLKGRGYASVPVDEQQPQTTSYSSRRESLMKRQPAAAMSYSSFGGAMEVGPSGVSQESFLSRPSFVSSLSTNGHVNGAAQVERDSFFSRQRSSLVSPTLPMSPTFAPSPTFPTSSTYSASPSFPLSPAGSHDDDPDEPDVLLLNKRREIESQFEALGGTMDSQSASALDRISRARKFLEESKRASEARMSVSTRDKYQISKKFLQKDQPDTSQGVDNGQIASPTDSVQSPVIESFSSRFVRSPTQGFHQDSTVIGNSSFPQSGTLPRFSNRYEEPNESSERDIFPPRYVPLKQDVNHSETSLFRPIEANQISQRLQNLRGSTEEEPYTFKREEHTEQSSSPMSHTLPRTKASQKSASSNSKEPPEPKAPKTSGYDRPTKSTAAKVVPETKPKPTKNPVKKTSKKLPQIAMFENMGQQNKQEEKTIKKGTRAKNVEPSREKTVQKMLFGKTAATCGDQADGSDVVSEDARSLDSAELVSISQRQSDFSGSKDVDKGSKSGTPSPRSKTPRPNRASPHSRLGRSGPSDKSSRSSSSDKSGQFSPGSRRKSVAESPSKSRSRRNSPERPRRKSISEHRSSTPLVRRNSIRATDGLRVEDKGTVSSRNKMVDKARSRSKPDLRDISISRDEKSPSKPTFRRSKSVGKQEIDDGPTDPKPNSLRKASLSSATSTKDSKSQMIQNSHDRRSSTSSSSESAWNSRTKASSSRQKSDVVQKAVAKLNNDSKATQSEAAKAKRSQNISDSKENKTEPLSTGKPIGGWEFIYVGPKERKSDDTKRFVDLSREIRGVELDPEDPDTIPVGPGVIRQVLDQFKRPQAPVQSLSNSGSQGAQVKPVNGDNEAYTPKTNDILDRVAQLKQSIKVGHKAALDAFQESSAMKELCNNRRQSTKSTDDGEVSEMGGAPLYRSSAFKLDLPELQSKSAEMSEDSWPTARSLDSESTDYDSAVEVQADPSVVECVLSVEEDSLSEYNSAAETFGSELDEGEAVPQHSLLVNQRRDFPATELFVEVTVDDSENTPASTPTPKGVQEPDCNLIAFDDEVETLVTPTTPQPSPPTSNNIDHLLFDFDPVPVVPVRNEYMTSAKHNASGGIENETKTSSLVDLDSSDEEDISQEENTEGETVLDRDVEGYDNLGFGSDEENEQDITMTDEIADKGYLCGNVSQWRHDSLAQSSNTVVDKSDDGPNSLIEEPDRNNSAISSEPFGATVEAVRPSLLNPSHILTLETQDSSETICNVGRNFESSPTCPAIPPSETTSDVLNVDDTCEPDKISLSDSSDKDRFSQKKTKTNPDLPDTSKVDTEIRKDISPSEFCELVSGQVVSSPDNKLDIISKEELSETNEVFLTTSSEPCLTGKGRMCSTETEGGSSEGDRDRLLSESDVTDASELKEGARGSSSSTAASTGGKKKRNRSESKKRRKRKHIEKAAAMRESVSTSQTQSEPSSPQQLKKSGSGKRSGRKAKGAILMTNLLVLDMGLSDPGPDLYGGEPGAVFLPLSQKHKSESEESIFDDAGSIADDESETDFKGHCETEGNTSVEDQAYLTPEAVSPEVEIPEPSFVKQNIFILQDHASAKDNVSTAKKEEYNVEPDTTICAMFKRTLGLLTRRQTQIESNAEISKPQLESDLLNTFVSVDGKMAQTESGPAVITHSQFIKEDIGPTIHLINPGSDPKSVVSTQSVDHHTYGEEVPSEENSFANGYENDSAQEPRIFLPPCDEQESDSGLVSPKLHRDQRQSFLFHNRFIQEDIKKKSAGPQARPEGRIFGRRRHRSAGTGVTRTSLSESSDGQSVSSTVSEDILNIDHPGSHAGPQSPSENTSSRKMKLSTRFVKDNLFFASDKRKAKSANVEPSISQSEVVKTSKPGEKGSSGSLGKALRASFRKLTHRKSKPKSAVSTQDLSRDQAGVEVQSQTGSMISSFGNSTPCLTAECYAPTYTGTKSNADLKINPIEEDQDVVQSRIHLTSWDPTPLLKELYAVRLLDETTEDLSHRFISMEGVMEKLPMGKRKSTLLKTWKRRYFKAADGWLHYYENNNYEKPCHSFQLMGGSIEVLDSRILGIDDGRGHYLMVRCPTPNDFENWKVSLESQTTDNVKAVHIRPVLNSQPHPSKKVVIIDIGSASVRAGILGKEASLPQLFFPTVVAKKTSSGECVVGFDAYRPDIRNQSTLHYPIRPSVKVDKGKSLPFNIDMSLLPYIFDKIFSDLKIYSKSYWVLLSTPQMLADKLKAEIMDVLIRHCGVQGVCIAPQALLAMYSYKATSGIIVDVGERIDILPISDGYIVEGGVTRHPFGGEKVADSLKQSLTRLHYHFFSEVERLIIRLVMEKTCYIPQVFSQEMKHFQENPGSFSKTVSLKNFGLPEGTCLEVTHDEGCFKSAEGFFDTDIWGTDFPSLHKLVHKAIIECPMDNRREMCRSIFLSGGVTLLPGFAERLELEITKLVPSGLTIQVHASPQRYHAAFIGGCTLAAQDLFQQTCISREDWIKNGVKELKKWHIPS